MKKKGGEDQDTKTSLIDDVYLQVCHIKFFFLICPMHFTVYLQIFRGLKKKHISLLCDLIIIFYQGILSENIFKVKWK